MQQLLLLNSQSAVSESGNSSVARTQADQPSGSGSGGFLSALEQAQRQLDKTVRGSENSSAGALGHYAGAASALVAGQPADGQSFSATETGMGSILPLDGFAMSGHLSTMPTALPLNSQALQSRITTYLNDPAVQAKFQEAGVDMASLNSFAAEIEALGANSQALKWQSFGHYGQGVDPSALNLLMSGKAELGKGFDQVSAAIEQLMTQESLDPSFAASLTSMQSLMNQLEAASGQTVLPAVGGVAVPGPIYGAIKSGAMSGSGRPGLSGQVAAGNSAQGLVAGSAQGWNMPETLGSSGAPNNLGLSEGGVLNNVQGAYQNPAQSTDPGLPLNVMTGQPQAEVDQNFKLSIEQAMLASSMDGGEDTSEEMLTRIADLSAAKASEAAGRGATRAIATSVDVPVGDPEWNAKMNEKVMWMASRGIQAAQIHLNPAELGPVDVKVSVQNDQTVIHFNVQNASVRELLESNVQRLRDMMDANGVALAEVNVDDGSSQQQGFAQEFADRQEQAGSGEGNHGDSDADSSEQAISSTISDLDDISLVDDYA